jgi:hypothetical protein
MRQQIFEEALKKIKRLASEREADGADLPSEILRQIEKLAEEALRRD